MHHRKETGGHADRRWRMRVNVALDAGGHGEIPYISDTRSKEYPPVFELDVVRNVRLCLAVQVEGDLKVVPDRESERQKCVSKPFPVPKQRRRTC